MDGAHKSSVSPLCARRCPPWTRVRRADRSLWHSLPGPWDTRNSPELPTVIGALRERAEIRASAQQRDLTWAGVWKTSLGNGCHLGGGGGAQLGSSLSHADERASTPRPTGCPDPQGVNTLRSNVTPATGLAGPKIPIVINILPGKISGAPGPGLVPRESIQLSTASNGPRLLASPATSMKEGIGPGTCFW